MCGNVSRQSAKRLTSKSIARWEARIRAIYTHWGFDRFLMRETEDGEEVLYYAKDI